MNKLEYDEDGDLIARKSKLWRVKITLPERIKRQLEEWSKEAVDEFIRENLDPKEDLDKKD